MAIGKSPLGVVGFLPFGRLPIIQPSLGITDLNCGHMLSCEISLVFGISGAEKTKTFQVAHFYKTPALDFVREVFRLPGKFPDGLKCF